MRQWFKFYGSEFLGDPKIMSLTPEERICWVTLLCLASANDDNNDNGVVKHVTEERLMVFAGFDTNHDSYDMARGVLKKLEKLDMIRIDNEMITICNWGKRQQASLTGYERVKRWREKKRLDNTDNKGDNANDNNRREEKRIKEKRIDIIGVAIATTPSDEAVDFFNKGKIYSELRNLLIQKIPEPLVDRELQKFIDYWTEPNKSGTKARWQLQPTFDVKRRIKTWLTNLKVDTKSKGKKII